MKGKWTAGSDENSGIYLDTRGVLWSVTSKPVGSGLIQQRQWTAQSQDEGDNGQWFSRTGWTVRTRNDLFDDIDKLVTGAAAPGSDVGMLVAVALVAFVLLDGKRR